MKKEIKGRTEILHFIFHNASLIIRRANGFTLLEILISLAILSVILAAVYGTFFLAQKAVEGMDESLVKIQEARRALDILRCELESAYFREADPNTLFQIKDRDIYGRSASHLAFMTFSGVRPGLSKISYYVEERDGTLHLYKKVDFVPQASEGTEGFEVIEHVDAFSIEGKYQDQWVKTWDTGIINTIPEEIRISLQFRLRDRMVRLSEIALPRIGKPI